MLWCISKRTPKSKPPCSHWYTYTHTQTYIHTHAACSSQVGCEVLFYSLVAQVPLWEMCPFCESTVAKAGTMKHGELYPGFWHFYLEITQVSSIWFFLAKEQFLIDVCSKEFKPLSHFTNMYFLTSSFFGSFFCLVFLHIMGCIQIIQNMPIYFKSFTFHSRRYK